MNPTIVQKWSRRTGRLEPTPSSFKFNPSTISNKSRKNAPVRCLADTPHWGRPILSGTLRKSLP